MQPSSEVSLLTSCDGLRRAVPRWMPGSLTCPPSAPAPSPPPAPTPSSCRARCLASSAPSPAAGERHAQAPYASPNAQTEGNICSRPLRQGLGQSHLVRPYWMCRPVCFLSSSFNMQGLERSSSCAGSLPQSACFRGSAWPASALRRRSCPSRIPARSRQKMRRFRRSKDAARLGTLPQFHIPMRTGQS